VRLCCSRKLLSFARQLPKPQFARSAQICLADLGLNSREAIFTERKRGVFHRPDRALKRTQHNSVAQQNDNEGGASRRSCRCKTSPPPEWSVVLCGWEFGLVLMAAGLAGSGAAAPKATPKRQRRRPPYCDCGFAASGDSSLPGLSEPPPGGGGFRQAGTESRRSPGVSSWSRQPGGMPAALPEVFDRVTSSFRYQRY